jgi:hypothetical protein
LHKYLFKNTNNYEEKLERLVLFKGFFSAEQVYYFKCMQKNKLKIKINKKNSRLDIYYPLFQDLRTNSRLL